MRWKLESDCRGAVDPKYVVPSLKIAVEQHIDL